MHCIALHCIVLHRTRNGQSNFSSNNIVQNVPYKEFHPRPSTRMKQMGWMDLGRAPNGSLAHNSMNNRRQRQPPLRRCGKIVMARLSFSIVRETTKESFENCAIVQRSFIITIAGHSNRGMKQAHTRLTSLGYDRHSNGQNERNRRVGTVRTPMCTNQRHVRVNFVG